MAKKKKGGSNPQEQLINLQAQQLAAQVANWAAQLDFQKARFSMLEMPEWQQRSALEVDKFAWDKAQSTWENAFKEATLTGTYQGQPTIDWLTRQAQLTGVMNGQQTLQGKLTDAQISQMNQQMKLANDEFLANTTGFYNGQKTFDRQKWEATQAQSAWQFMSTLSGPQNAFKQARAIGSMPGGLSQMMGAWAGQFSTPGMTSVGSGGRASLGDMMLGSSMESGGQMDQGFYYGLGVGENRGAFSYAAPPSGGPFFGQTYAPNGYPESAMAAQAAPAANAVPGYTYSPPGAQAPVDAWNYTQTPMGNTQVYPPGVASPAHTPDISTQTPVAPDQVSALYGGQYQYAQPAAPQVNTAVPVAGVGSRGTLLPNQINAENYGNMYDYQKELGWAAFEDAGWDKGLAQQAFQRSLPRYGGPESGTVKF